MVQVGYITWYQSLRDLHSLGPAALGVYINHIETSTLCYNHRFRATYVYGI